MKVVGSDSWSVSMSVDALPHAALYIRDALGLETSADDASPPPLSHRPPDRRALLTQDEAAQVSSQWLSWWRLILEYTARTHEPSSDRTDFMTWHTAIAADRAATVGDEPRFDALERSPVLRRAVVELYPEASEWPEQSGSHDARDPQIFWQTTRDVAEEMAKKHGVSAGEVWGVVLVLCVDGTWAHLLKPSVIVCAEGCLADSTAAADVVRTVLESSLTT